MPTMRVKLDYNHLMEEIDDFLNGKSEDDDKLVFGIGMGLNLLTSYIKNIAERAIELNDDVLTELLVDMMVLKKSEEGGAE